MKVHFYIHRYFWPADGVIEDTYHLSRIAHLFDAPDSTIQGFNQYLLSALETDFRDGDGIDGVLVDIARLEAGEIENCLAGTPDNFMHSLTRTQVTFEHAIFGECPEWPLWSCTLAQYKAALQGWKQFLQLPKSIDSELIVELPDAAP